jgi:uncharacterized protein YjiS (DUF1127 family)
MIKCKNIRLLNVLWATKKPLRLHIPAAPRRQIMTTPQTNATGTTFTLALVRMAAHQVRRFVQALANRRAVTAMHALDDRALKDIGLTRADVQSALMKPFGEDPSSHLVALRTGVEPSKLAAVATSARWNRAQRSDEAVCGQTARA